MSGKRDRQAAILEVLREHRVGSQETLREHLQARGIDVTQATVSRDVRDLRLVKVPDADGSAFYTLPDEFENLPPLDRLLPTLFVSAEGTGNLLVVKTMTGGAQAVALGVDWEEWPEIMGTIAGDDTILIICREAAQVDRVRERLEQMADRS